MTIDQHIRELFTAHYTLDLRIDLPLRQSAEIFVELAVDWVFVHRLATFDELFALKSVAQLLELGHQVTLARAMSADGSAEAQQLAADLVASWEKLEAATRETMAELAELEVVN